MKVMQLTLLSITNTYSFLAGNAVGIPRSGITKHELDLKVGEVTTLDVEEYPSEGAIRSVKLFPPEPAGKDIVEIIKEESVVFQMPFGGPMPYRDSKF